MNYCGETPSVYPAHNKKRLLYTQGDYSLFQCSEPCHDSTYENQDVIFKMIETQGYRISENGTFLLPDGIVSKACVNYGKAACPEKIAFRSIIVDTDIEEVLSASLF